MQLVANGAGMEWLALHGGEDIEGGLKWNILSRDIETAGRFLRMRTPSGCFSRLRACPARLLPARPGNAEAAANPSVVGTSHRNGMPPFPHREGG